MSQLPADRRETWITGVGLVSSLGTGWRRIGTLSAAAAYKSMIGHILSAAGIIEAVFTLWR